MTAATTAVAVSPAAVFGAIGVIALIGRLMAKELLLLSGSEKVKRFGRVASVAIVWSRNGDVRYIGDNIFEECRDIEKR